MQFIVYQQNLNKYFCNEGKVIVFNDEQEARNFVNAFYQTYALPTAMQEMMINPSLMGTVISASQCWAIQELPEKYEYKIVNFEDLKNKR